MAVPKRKTSKSVRGQRRSHDKLKKVNVVINKTSGAHALSHCVSEDGYYNGVLVLAQKIKKSDEK